MEQAVRKIALLGMGTVGGGVYEIIERQKEEMPFKIGAALEVVKVLGPPRPSTLCSRPLRSRRST